MPALILMLIAEAYFATDGYDLSNIGLENLKERLKVHLVIVKHKDLKLINMANLKSAFMREESVTIYSSRQLKYPSCCNSCESFVARLCASPPGQYLELSLFMAVGHFLAVYLSVGQSIPSGSFWIASGNSHQPMHWRNIVWIRRNSMWLMQV